MTHSEPDHTTIRNGPGVRPDGRVRAALAGLGAGLLYLSVSSSLAAEPGTFHSAPPEAAKLVNPFAGQASAADAGRELFAAHCAVCHGRSAEGTGNIPALAHGAVQRAADGEIFWFITKGSNNGLMPSWIWLPEQQRWQIVTYLKNNAP